MRSENPASNVIPLRRTLTYTAPQAPREQEGEKLHLPAGRVLTHEEAEVLRAQIPEGGLQRCTLEAYLAAESYTWRCTCLLHNPWLIGFLAALPPPVRAV